MEAAVQGAALTPRRLQRPQITLREVEAPPALLDTTHMSL